MVFDRVILLKFLSGKQMKLIKCSLPVEFSDFSFDAISYSKGSCVHSLKTILLTAGYSYDFKISRGRCFYGWDSSLH